MIYVLKTSNLKIFKHLCGLPVLTMQQHLYGFNCHGLQYGISLTFHVPWLTVPHFV